MTFLRKSCVNQLVLIASFLLLNRVSSICVFPPEFEGEYIIQNALVNSDVMQYSTINITADWISPYGQCYERDESNVIVVLSAEDNPCFRCFNLQMVSKNIILLIHNEVDINSKCSSSAETVKCPKEIALNDENKFENDFHSIILYRKSERDGPRRNEFCPFDFFDGEIKFDYYLNEDKVCSGFESTLSQCPSGSSMSFRFKGCNHPVASANLECIGSWQASNQHYLAVIDWINGTMPRYKCGTYFYDNAEKTGITMKISNDCSDSSLSTKNSISKKNQQTFKIKKTIIDLKVPAEAKSLEFPSWLQGDWQMLKVNKGRLVFRDQSSFKSYRMSLVNQLSDEKFIVLTRSQCGEESFKCLWIRNLDSNILEFQMGSESPKKLLNFMLCNDEHFDTSRWLTQARVGRDVMKTSCPIKGTYVGKLPDDLELCSMMKSNCNSLDVMNFQIGLCGTTEIYEKRIYKCLGQWTDKESSTVYTFTKRLDVVNTYECFVGLMTGSEKQIVIREAGENCYKFLDPQKYGMEMNQTELCRNDGSGTDEEIIVKPTQKDTTSIVYETVFDDENNDIDFNVATTSRKPKTTKKHKHDEHDENSVENEISYEPTSIAASASRVMYSCGFLLMICNLQNSIIVKSVL